MVELGLDALQVADAVAVRVEEAARIDLIEDRPLPPVAIVTPGQTLPPPPNWEPR